MNGITSSWNSFGSWQFYEQRTTNKWRPRESTDGAHNEDDLGEMTLNNSRSLRTALNAVLPNGGSDLLWLCCVTRMRDRHCANYLELLQLQSPAEWGVGESALNIAER